MGNIIIQAENISKSFIISHETKAGYNSLGELVGEYARRLFRKGKQASTTLTNEEFWALKGINFEINRGDRVGIIGRNGAGKSTLLKVLSRITEPTLGRIQINGRVASLLEVGTGFHPELTGRENIFLNGAILGMSRSEIRKKFDEIVSFAEVEQFLDTPVKRYSSGMYVRLAFAVAAHLEPEILIVDEVLAVGDAQFQKKCLGKMEDVSKNEGRTVLFVSHNIASIKSLCNKGFLLESGVKKFAGTMNETIHQYLSLNNGSLTNSIFNFRCFTNLFIQEFSLNKYSFSNQESIKYSISLIVDNSSIQDFCILIFNEINERIAIIDLRNNNFLGLRLNKLVLDGEIEKLPLIPGLYKIGLFLSTTSNSANFFDLVSFEIVDSIPSNFIKYPVDVRGIVELNNMILKSIIK